MFLSSPPAQEIQQTISSSKEIEMRDVLQRCYGVPEDVSEQILHRLKPLLENLSYHDILTDFCKKSEELKVLSTPTQQVSTQIVQALEKYPCCHKVLFENDRVRILWTETKRQEKEPFQVHPWKSLMIIVQSSQFESQASDGSTFTDDWPIGCYALDPLMNPMSCKNIGNKDYQGIVFEIKNN